MKNKPFLIIIDGPMGSGKSTTARKLHQKMPLSAFISLDFIRRIISNFDLDNKEHHKLASEVLDMMVVKYLKEKYTVIIERSIMTENDISRLKKQIGKKAKMVFYRIEAPFNIRLKRVKKRKLPFQLKKWPVLKKIKRNNKYYNELKHQRVNRIFDSTKLSTLQIINKIIKDIQN